MTDRAAQSLPTFLARAVALRLLDEALAFDCLRIRDELRALGQELALDEIAEIKRYLTADQAQAVKEALSREPPTFPEAVVDEGNPCLPFAPTEADLEVAGHLQELWSGVQVGQATIRRTREEHDGVAIDVLHASGHLDDADRFTSYLVSLLLVCSEALVLDLTGLRYLTSACLGALIRGQDMARARGKALYLLPMARGAEVVFGALGLGNFIRRAETVADAAAKWRSARAGGREG